MSSKTKLSNQHDKTAYENITRIIRELCKVMSAEFHFHCALEILHESQGVLYCQTVDGKDDHKND